ncbi:MAG: flagellar export protein FliJ [Candidatus Omnitrophota bacterium]
MRNFRFRLDPMIRLKEYQIQKKEEEIAALEDQIQQLLREIDEGRQAVQDMRRRLLEETEDKDLIQVERSLDMFRAYMNRVEQEKRARIAYFRQQQDEKRKELVTLYQEEKILDRLKEKRRLEWETEMRKEEGAMLDEIGTQKYVRRAREHGGVILYLLVPLALAGAAAAIGFYTGAVDKSLLAKIPFLGFGVKGATEAVSPVSATEESRYLTTEELLGNIKDPMPKALENLVRERERLTLWQKALEEKEKDLNIRSSILDDREAMVSGQIKQASQLVTAFQDYLAKIDEREKSALSEREQTMAKSLAAGSEKTIAQMAVSLFQAANTTTPEDKEQDQLILIRILTKMTPSSRDKLLSAIHKADPQTGAEILKKFINTDINALYGITPPTPSAIVSPITIPSATRTLPPPIEQNIGGGTPPSGG